MLSATEWRHLRHMHSVVRVKALLIVLTIGTNYELAHQGDEALSISLFI